LENRPVCFITDRNLVLQQINNSIKATEPEAKAILLGSCARGDFNEDSDIDLLILILKDKVNYEDETRITYALFLIEINTGISISPLVFSKDFWEKGPKITPFYENVNREGGGCYDTLVFLPLRSQRNSQGAKTPFVNLVVQLCDLCGYFSDTFAL